MFSIQINYLTGLNLSIFPRLDGPHYTIKIFNNKNQIEEIKTCGGLYSYSYKYFIDYKVQIWHENKLIFKDSLNLKNKNILINIESPSFGDMLSWLPYIELFKRKHKCNIFVLSNFGSFFDKSYDFTFIDKINNIDLYAIYNLGIYHDIWREMHKTHPRRLPLQKVAAEILDVTFKQIKPKFNKEFYIKNKRKEEKNKLICICTEASRYAQEWNYYDEEGGWIKLINYLINKGYDIVDVSKNPKIYHPKIYILEDNSLEQTLKKISESKFFIGLNSTLSWCAWALNKPVVTIGGFAEPFFEFNHKYKIYPKNGCRGCFNNENLSFDDYGLKNRPNCPFNKNYECSKISFDIVKKNIDNLLKEL